MAEIKRIKAVDRLSELPDEIIDHIFSFMDMKFVVQTCVLSKRWENLWKSATTLNFRLLGETYEIRQSKKSNFMHFVDQVLRLRHDSHMLKFSLNCATETNASRVCGWVETATNRNVEVIHLRSIPRYYNEVPNHHIFTSNVRTVNLTCTRVSNSMFSARLMKSLTLYMVHLPDMDVHGKLNLSWPNLETLVLKRCRLSRGGLLTLSLPLLGKLELFNLYVCGGEHFKVVVSCPNLTSLKCFAEDEEEYCFGDLPLLHSADIHLYSHECSQLSRGVYVDRIGSALQSVCNASGLTLTSSLFKSLSKHSSLMEMIPIVFHNLRLVTLRDWNHMACVNELAKLLELLPCIQILVWDRSKQCGTKKAEDLPLQDAFISLKTLKIWGARLDGVELEFMTFLLKRAKFLNKISITARNKKSVDLKQFKERILDSAKDSSCISVSVQTMKKE